jgi:hypothetical protein
LICIALGSGDNGAVLFWDHNSEGRSENGGNFYRISDGFAKFLESMYSEA